MTREREVDAALAATVTPDARPATPALDHTAPASAPLRGAPPETLVIGALLGGRYEVRGYLGHGGMGAVYRAHDAVLGEEVALKVVRAGFADELRQEVRVAQKVTHRNVCRTYDLEEVDGRQFVKMEYIDGETLAQSLAKRGALPIGEVVRIARAVADGLAAAHTQGIVHRDLKPGNVMLSGERVVLMDFGLARAVADTPGDRAGTPIYMSPEQLAGKELDERSDLFALGCLIYEMLTREHAYGRGAGSYTQLVATRADQAAPDVRAKRRETPRWLARSVTALLAHDPATRPRGSDGLRRGADRRRIAAALAVVAIAAPLAWWWSREPSTPTWRPAIETLKEYAGNADVPEISPDGQTVMFSADNANMDRWAVYTMPIGGGPARQITTDDKSCLRGRWADGGRAILMQCHDANGHRAFRQSIEGGPPQVIEGVTAAEPCGDATLVVQPSKGGSTVVLRHPARADRIMASVIEARGGARCSADGRQIMVVDHGGVHGGALRIFDDAGRAGPILRERALPGGFTPGGRSILFTEIDGTRSKLVELVLATGKAYDVLPGEEHARAPSLSPDGKTLVFHRDQTWLPLHELLASGVRVLRSEDRDSFYRVVPGPTADVVIATRPERDPIQIEAITLSTGAQRVVAHGDAPFISRDGQRVFYQSLTDPSELMSVPFAGGAPTRVVKMSGALLRGVDGPDGIHLEVAHGGASEAWLVPAAGGAPVPEGTSGLVFPAPSGGWRAVRSVKDGIAVLRLVAPGQPLTTHVHERSKSYGRPAWVDEHRFSYCDVHRCRVLDVVSGDETEGVPNPSLNNTDFIAAAPDGERWYFTPLDAAVTLHKVTNFDTRPWKP